MILYYVDIMNIGLIVQSQKYDLYIDNIEIDNAVPFTAKRN